MPILNNKLTNFFLFILTALLEFGIDKSKTKKEKTSFLIKFPIFSIIQLQQSTLHFFLSLEEYQEWNGESF